ncbi:beta-glucuronidase [Actinomadura sp. DC4]|uniref:beta-glucuronidase n=1 Tax=Actinomadura sp. DC4 TaxID=3055069 RepID=UPI0025B0D646|nr:beta-glucuronidase [Actinomadura sp. DC4]MDN3359161.1 beta-glucuronidase [Actinomadura sp. DC4]
MLRPLETASRERVSLNGLWAFALDPGDRGRPEEWWRGPLPEASEMPVPSSFNDVPATRDAHDHVGDVWYQRSVRIPAGWEGRRVVLRFDAAAHRAVVWWDDVEVGRHEGGYTPFECDLTGHVRPGEAGRVTVVVDNRLDLGSIPPGIVDVLPDGRRRQRYFHDFFNYAGLHRAVWLYTTPASYVEDITVTTEVTGTDARVLYRADVAGGRVASVVLRDAGGVERARADTASGTLSVPDATLWRPGHGHLYELEVSASGGDVYTLPVGIREVAVEGDRFLINGEPFHFRGFGKHEDNAVRGKGHDDVLMVHDFALLDWVGANSFRTSHYPYAEEVLEYADRHGIVVIDETPAVGLNFEIAHTLVPGDPPHIWAAVGDTTQEAHRRAIEELVARDKNHPSVVMWSIANEPDSARPQARTYFEPLVRAARAADPSRPVCFAQVQLPPDQDVMSDLFDVICLNRYYGWYVDTGDLVTAERELEAELREWARLHGKPIIVTEYGADAVAGVRSVAAGTWTEDYQVELLEAFHRAFDRVESVVGEHVWNFADFATGYGVNRADGNKKGVFTRDRRPKAAAFALRRRWTGR